MEMGFQIPMGIPWEWEQDSNLGMGMKRNENDRRWEWEWEKIPTALFIVVDLHFGLSTPVYSLA